MQLLRELHLKFLESLPKLTESKYEYILMSHLRTSVLYWSLTAQSLLCSDKELNVTQEEALNFLQSVYRPECGGFAGDSGAHDAHLLFTLSALQIFQILKCGYPDWFDVDKCVQCNILLLSNYLLFL